MRFLKYIFCALLFVTASVADTININWINDGATYAQTTCEIGGDIILPESPTKRGYTFKGWRQYTRLEYIESTGTQYIDTGIKGNQDTEIRSKWASTKVGKWVYGTGTSGPRITMYCTSSANQRFGNAVVSINTFGSSGEIHVAIQNKTGVLFDNKLYGYTNVGTFTLTNNLTIFANKYEGSSSHFIGKMYYLQIFDGNTMVRNFIPAKCDPDNTIGMYDTVSQTFFTNAGTGEFIAGPVAENQNFYE